MEYKGLEIAKFNLYTQKRGGLKRIIALPLKFEPMAEPLHKYMVQFGKDRVFNFTRQKLWFEGKKRFEGLTYPIYTYTIYENGKVVKSPPTHQKNFTPHALRHLRASELIEYYGFTGFNLAIYGGWTMKSMVGFSGQFDRYVSLDWQSYIEKMLMKRVL